MKIEQSSVTKLTLTEIEGLDPVTVILENYAPGKGKIIIECYGESWSSYWGAMSGDSIEQFFIRINHHYAATNLSTIKSDIDCDSEEFAAKLRKEIVSSRKQGEFTKVEARELFNDAEHFELEQPDHALASRVFGPDWWYSIPQKPNPDYQYLCRIIDNVQQGLKLYINSKTDKDAA
ncbi:hypothetical protein [Shewanella sp. MBTL60-007]|uniref:hypothetical protein n=1 Tax=Shewanella sp. MBTL60-007 TaxID=2815911 RepID=UPI001BBF8DDB|nr:hypothetical protein [Shewanella sp. MBTL60-007]GIU22107.1 hypothetical protein TUM3792_23780 [Shewanella sp. MBTL60-007]